MLNVKALYNLLPVKFKNKKEVIIYEQDVNDIIKELVKVFNKYKFDYDYISPEFYTGHFKQDLVNLWSFCRYNLTYKIEGEEAQVLQSPSAILYLSNNGGSVDCKCLSLFVAGVIDSWYRLGLYDNKIKSLNFVFASYDRNPQPQHVFVECNNYWIDPVLPHFNDNNKLPTFTKNKNIMLMTLAGTNPRQINKNIYRDVFGESVVMGDVSYTPPESAQAPASSSVPVPSSSVPVPGNTPPKGSPNNTTPPKGSPNNTTPPKGSPNNTTPPKGSPNNTKPPATTASSLLSGNNLLWIGAALLVGSFLINDND